MSPGNPDRGVEKEDREGKALNKGYAFKKVSTVDSWSLTAGFQEPV